MRCNKTPLRWWGYLYYLIIHTHVIYFPFVNQRQIMGELSSPNIHALLVMKMASMMYYVNPQWVVKLGLYWTTCYGWSLKLGQTQIPFIMDPWWCSGSIGSLTRSGGPGDTWIGSYCNVRMGFLSLEPWWCRGSIGSLTSSRAVLETPGLVPTAMSEWGSFHWSHGGVVARSGLWLAVGRSWRHLDRFLLQRQNGGGYLPPPPHTHAHTLFSSFFTEDGTLSTTWSFGPTDLSYTTDTPRYEQRLLN
jgi:hypothetical protein